ncbi:MAG: hypothetical protein BKP49_07880 [Treponema sp. CETP13]|nr:MAG: hypothetical protein BKP49_07880 [Treponema sp. CETP13]
MRHWILLAVDTCTLILSLILSYFIRLQSINFMRNEYKNVFIMLVLINVVIFFLANNYKDFLQRGLLKESWYTFVHTVVVFAAVAVYFVVTQSNIAVSRIFLFLFIFSYLILGFMGRIVIKAILRNYVSKQQSNKKLIIVTTQKKAEESVKLLTNKMYYDYELIGLILLDRKAQENVQESILGLPVVCSAENALDYLKNNIVDEVLMNVPSRVKFPTKLWDGCVEMGITLHRCIQGINQVLGETKIERMGSAIVLTSSMRLASSWQIVAKRLLDIFGSIVGLLICFVVGLFVAPLIYKKDHGPVFFAQTRVGKNGRRFKLYKFRSMYVDAEKKKEELIKQNKMQGCMFKLENDPRILPGIGTFIRKTSIDELPQFWCVLKGDMSLVGTRPPLVSEVKEYEYRHKRRLAIKPGITGLWQVSGRNDITDFEEIVALDSEYISTWTIGLDIKVLLKTVAVVFCGKGSM